MAARDAGLRALALTDHDTVDGISDARGAALAVGIDLVPGVELSAYEGPIEVHILGLHLDKLDDMRSALAVFRSARRERAEGIVKLLNGLGVRITFDDVLAEAKDAAIGRPHVARALVQSPTALLADEPSGNLDQETGDRLHVLLRRLNQEKGITLVVVTHNERLAAASDRVLRLENGRLHNL